MGREKRRKGNKRKHIWEKKGIGREGGGNITIEWVRMFRPIPGIHLKKKNEMGE